MDQIKTINKGQEAVVLSRVAKGKTEITWEKEDTTGMKEGNIKWENSRFLVSLDGEV